MKKIFFCTLSKIFLAIFIVFTSCQRNVDPGDFSVDDRQVSDSEKVNASVRGVVVDGNNQPIQGAIVYSGFLETTTDQNGVFLFKDVPLSKANGYVKVVKPGYFDGGRTFLSVDNRIHNVRIKLLEKRTVGTFAAEAGGTINLPDGGRISLPGAAIADESGNVYKGQVNVAMTWIDPTSVDLSSLVLGDLRGVTSAGVERGLQTFGMLGVELSGNNGQSVKIINGKKAELAFPIPASLVAIAPESIDLWHFDESVGRWKQEGKATKNGTNYIGQVSHFSFWNCDAPFPLVNMSVRLLNASDSLPLNNVHVRIRRTTASNAFSSGYTDSLGNIYGAIPKNEPLLLEVLNQCSDVIHSQNFGPIATQTDLGTIKVSVPIPNSITIKGTISDCSDINIASGTALINTDNGFSYAAPVTNGSFSITLLKCNTTGPFNFTITGFDHNTLQFSTALTNSVSSGVIDVGTIQTCGTTLDEYIEMLVDSTPFRFIYPIDSINVVSRTDTGAYKISTSIYGSRSYLGIGDVIILRFKHNDIPGTYPLYACTANTTDSVYGTATQIISPSPTITISNYDPSPSGLLQGNVDIQMRFAGNTNRRVKVNFRVRR